MPIASLPDVNIHYELSGSSSKPVLVLSNALGTRLQLWEPQLPAFAEHFRVLRYDSRGHGQSSVPPGPYSIEILGRDVVALLDHLGLHKAHFCGLSVGGMTGMWLGRRAPERLHKLVLCNTRSWNDVAGWDSRIASVRQYGLKAMGPAILERWFSPQFREQSPETVAAARKMLEETPEAGYLATCEAIRDMDLRGELAHIRVPTLVISGSLDIGSPPGEGRFIVERIPGAQYVELNTAHISNLESPSAFTAEVTRFLTS